MQLILYSVLISIVIFIIQIFFIIRKEKKTMKTIKNQSYFKFIIKIIVDKKIYNLGLYTNGDTHHEILNHILLKRL